MVRYLKIIYIEQTKLNKYTKSYVLEANTEYSKEGMYTKLSGYNFPEKILKFCVHGIKRVGILWFAYVLTLHEFLSMHIYQPK